jgi:hypothetical protein
MLTGPVVPFSLLSLRSLIFEKPVPGDAGEKSRHTHAGTKT